jgi:enoyl-CoA hydratase/carnithine racemase
VRSGRCRRHGAVCAAGRQHRRLLHHAGGGRGAQHRPEAGDGNAPHRRLFDAHTASSWDLVNRVVPAERLDDAIRLFTDILAARSSATVRRGKAAFYAQIDRPLEAADDIAGAQMVRNLLLEDAAEGMDAFLQKRQARWLGR